MPVFASDEVSASVRKQASFIPDAATVGSICVLFEEGDNEVLRFQLFDTEGLELFTTKRNADFKGRGEPRAYITRLQPNERLVGMKFQTESKENSGGKKERRQAMTNLEFIFANRE
jgi:hypothetical protein